MSTPTRVSTDIELSRLYSKIEELQQRLTAADERVDVLESALKGMLEYFPEGHSDGECFSVEKAKAALKPAEANDDSCEFCKGWGFSSNSDGADEGCGACNGTGKEPAEGGGDE